MIRCSRTSYLCNLWNLTSCLGGQILGIYKHVGFRFVHGNKCTGIPLLKKDNIAKLREGLKLRHCQLLYPLKDLLEFYCEEEDPSLLVDIKTELLSIYGHVGELISSVNKPDFESLILRFDSMTEELYAGPLDNWYSDEIVLEIKGGVGGKEAQHFATELFHMYEMIADDRGFEFNIVNDGVACIKGGIEFFKYEFGVHRIQRVPFNCKKIQTSSATVAVVPHGETSNICIKRSDLIIETMRSSGSGGQSVNKSETAVRVTHIPTGIVVKVQDTSSQIDNKARALELLSERLIKEEGAAIKQVKRQAKKFQYRTGDRSERIRTFQFLNDIVIDHRCNVRILGVESFLRDGRGIDRIHEALKEADKARIVSFVVDNVDHIADFLCATSE